MDRENDILRSYSAEEIAKVIVRRFDQIVGLVSYEHICDLFGNGLPLDDLPKEVKEQMLSLDAARDDLRWLGFRDHQIERMIGAYEEIQSLKSIHAMFKPDISAEQDYVKDMFWAAACFPYGVTPSFALSGWYPMEGQGYSKTLVREMADSHTSKLASRLMQIRAEDPTILSIFRGKISRIVQNSDNNSHNLEI